MAHVTRVKYFTKDKEKFINPDNLKKYKKYLQSNIIKNQDVKDTTYKRYEGLFRHFLMWLGENYGDLDLYSDEFMENAVDIMENYIMFCQETLLNHKKIINMKISAVSSFYIWSMKRGFVKYHPFDGKLDRMKKYGEIIGISDYRPHCQRKTRLNLVYEETGDLALAAELANHRSTETTREFYCRKQTKAEVMNKINALRNKNSNVTDEENK